MSLNLYQRVAFRFLGRAGERFARANPRLHRSLLGARIPVRPDVYIASSYLTSLGVLVAMSLLVAMALIASIFGDVGLPLIGWLFLLTLPLVLSLVLLFVLLLQPQVRAAMRRRDIDAKLPYALKFIATMSGGGVTPDKIFSALAEQPIYGEVANEAAWISRDLDLLGMDMLTALEAAIDRTPSLRFKDLLQGAMAALTAGESLKDYFAAKSFQYVVENRQEQKKFIDSLGVLAESYVTVVVGAPLFLIIMLSAMLMFGASGESVLFLGYLLIFVMLPLAQLLFGSSAKFAAPEA